MQAPSRRLLSQEVSQTYVATYAPVQWLPHTPPRRRETKLRGSDGHSELPTCGAMLLLVLCGPLGTEGLISWGARKDARAVG